MSKEEQYYEHLTTLGNRYKNIVENTRTRMWYYTSEYDEIFDFIDNTFLPGCEEKLPLMKLNRWIGYIQGVLIAKRLTTVEKERDFTRPMFRPLDFEE